MLSKKLFEYATFITILALPSYLIRFSIFGVPTNTLDILIIITLALWILERDFQGFAEWASKNKVYLIVIGIIFPGFIISALINFEPLRSFGLIKSWFALPVLFALAAAKKQDEEFKKKIFIALYVSSVSVSLAALGYLIAGHVRYDGRLQGFFNSPNYLAMYLAPSIIIGASLLNFQFSIFNFQFWKNKKNIFVIISLAIILVIFYKTYSYAAWVSLIIAGIVMIFIKYKTSLKIGVILGIISILIVYSQWNNPKFQSYINYNSRSSLASRSMIWKSSALMLRENPVFGIGMNNFQNKYLANQKYFPPYLEWAVPHPHNVYLAFWLYGGMLGIAGFLGLVFLKLRDIAKIKNVWAIGALGIFLYFLFHGFFDTTIFKNDLAVVFWLVSFL